MSLSLEAQKPKLRKPRSKPKLKRRPILPKWSPLDEPLSPDHPDQILTFFEWCQLNRISVQTGRRILDRGEVTVTQLTPKRVGITIGDNAKWQKSKARTSNDTQPRYRQRRKPGENAKPVTE